MKKPKRTNRLKAGVARVEAALLLRCLAHIATHVGVAEPELREITGLSRASNMRLLAYAREQFGVVVAWRHDNALPAHGEYSISDWGVFDPTKIFSRTKKRKRRSYRIESGSRPAAVVAASAGLAPTAAGARIR